MKPTKRSSKNDIVLPDDDPTEEGEVEEERAEDGEEYEEDQDDEYDVQVGGARPGVGDNDPALLARLTKLLDGDLADMKSLVDWLYKKRDFRFDLVGELAKFRFRDVPEYNCRLTQQAMAFGGWWIIVAEKSGISGWLLEDCLRAWYEWGPDQTICEEGYCWSSYPPSRKELRRGFEFARLQVIFQLFSTDPGRLERRRDLLLASRSRSRVISLLEQYANCAGADAICELSRSHPSKFKRIMRWVSSSKNLHRMGDLVLDTMKDTPRYVYITDLFARSTTDPTLKE